MNKWILSSLGEQGQSIVQNIGHNAAPYSEFEETYGMLLTKRILAIVEASYHLVVDSSIEPNYHPPTVPTSVDH